MERVGFPMSCWLMAGWSRSTTRRVIQICFNFSLKCTGTYCWVMFLESNYLIVQASSTVSCSPRRGICSSPPSTPPTTWWPTPSTLRTILGTSWKYTSRWCIVKDWHVLKISLPVCPPFYNPSPGVQWEEEEGGGVAGLGLVACRLEDEKPSRQVGNNLWLTLIYMP